MAPDPLGEGTGEGVVSVDGVTGAGFWGRGAAGIDGSLGAPASGGEAGFGL
jgi:hypothetical protein